MASTESPLKVALIPSSYHPHFGGVEQHTRMLARELRRRGHPVEVWTVDRGERLGRQVVDDLDVHYLHCPMPNRSLGGLARFTRAFPGALWSWLRRVRAFRPDVIHVHCFGPNGPYARLVSSVLSVPLVLTSHGETFGDESDVFGQSALLRDQLRRACRGSAAVTGCSVLVAEDLRRRFGAEVVRVVPNAVDVLPASRRDAARPGDAARDGSTGGRLIAVGRLVGVKGFDVLLRALSLTSRWTSLMIVGDGPDRATLERLAGELGIADRVHFLGQRTAEEVQLLMSRADAVVMPSRAEAFGIVALEAWAAGTPLIATATGGPDSFVTDGVNGLLVPPGDSSALAQAIDTLLTDSALGARLSQAGAIEVEKFTWEEVASRYLDIYADVRWHAEADPVG